MNRNHTDRSLLHVCWSIKLTHKLKINLHCCQRSLTTETEKSQLHVCWNLKLTHPLVNNLHCCQVYENLFRCCKLKRTPINVQYCYLVFLAEHAFSLGVLKSLPQKSRVELSCTKPTHGGSEMNCFKSEELNICTQNPSILTQGKSWVLRAWGGSERWWWMS